MRFRIIFRPRLAVHFAIFALVFTPFFLVDQYRPEDPTVMFIVVPTALLLLVVVWSTQLWPFVEVSRSGLVLRNLWRTIIIPWDRMTGIRHRGGISVDTDRGSFLARGIDMGQAASFPPKMRVIPRNKQFLSSPQLTFRVHPSIALGILQNEFGLAVNPVVRPPLFAEAAANLLRLEQEGHCTDSRFGSRFERSVVIRWNLLPLTVHVLLGAVIVGGIVMRG